MFFFYEIWYFLMAGTGREDELDETAIKVN